MARWRFRFTLTTGLVMVLGGCALALTVFSLYRSSDTQAQTTQTANDTNSKNSDYNIGLLGVNPVGNNPSIQPFSQNQGHWIDPNAPKLTTLVRGSPFPPVAQSVNLSRPNGQTINTQANPETYAEFGGVLLAGNPGQTFQVPWSGYEVSPGHHVTIAYADYDTITLTYNGDGDISYGYAVQLNGLQVSSEIVRMYQEALASGQVVALSAGTTIGAATNQQVLLLMRDTGAFMNPMWEEWWNLAQITGVPLPPELLALIRQRFPQALPNGPECSVNGQIPDDGEFRPNPCENCRLQVPKPVNSCATTTTLQHPVAFSCDEVDSCGDQYIGTKTWETNFLIDTTKSKVPFAGYRVTKDENPQNRSENLNQYLNDYFDGTALYDWDVYDGSDQAQRNLVWEAGVFRKLAPQQVQDDYRVKLISKGYDYEVKQIGKSMQDWNTGRYSKINPNGHLPPNPKDPNYLTLYQEWQQMEPWGTYWHYIPMFSREDAPGKVTLSIQRAPGDLDPGENGAKKGTGVAEIPLSVPHLTRAYESTKALNELLMPEIKASEFGTPVPRQLTQPASDAPCQSDYGPGYPSALGCIPTTAAGLISWLLNWGSLLGGGLAFVLMAWGAMLFMTSQGDKKKVQQGKEWFIGGLVGLLVIILGTWLYGLIASKILQIPGFGQNESNNGNLAQIPSREGQATSRGVLSQVSYLNTNNSSLSSLKSPSSNLYAQAALSDTTERPLLAQANGQPQNQSDRFLFNIQPTVNPNGSYKVHLSATQWLGDAQVEVHVDGQKIGSLSGGPHNVGPGYDQEFGSAGSGAWFTGSGIPDLPPGNHTVNFVVLFNGPLPEGFSANNAILSCTVTDGVSSCQSFDNPTFANTGPQCGNPNQYTPPQCSLDGTPDPNPDLDSTCCGQEVKAIVTDYISTFAREDYINSCECDPALDDGCDKTLTDIQTREMGVKIQLPYLREIWKQTADEKTGVFQIFNPQRLLKFPDDAAESDIAYRVDGGDVSLTKQEGKVNWPYLYGIQKTKKCISEVMLTPKDLQDPNGATAWCDFATQEQLNQVTSKFGTQL